MFMVLSSWHCHCESSPVSCDECRLSAWWPPTLRPNQPIRAVSPPKDWLLPSADTIAIYYYYSARKHQRKLSAWLLQKTSRWKKAITRTRSSGSWWTRSIQWRTHCTPCFVTRAASRRVVCVTPWNQSTAPSSSAIFSTRHSSATAATTSRSTPPETRRQGTVIQSAGGRPLFDTSLVKYGKIYCGGSMRKGNYLSCFF